MLTVHPRCGLLIVLDHVQVRIVARQGQDDARHAKCVEEWCRADCLRKQRQARAEASKRASERKAV